MRSTICPACHNQPRAQNPLGGPFDFCSRTCARKGVCCTCGRVAPCLSDRCSELARIPASRQCTNCQAREANPGHAWCQSCFLSSQASQASQAKKTQTCTQCHTRAANPGRAWCEYCFRASQAKSNKKCTNCEVYDANPGYSWCQQCYEM